MIFWIILFTFFSNIFCKAEDKLIHVHALWRHGERNPTKLYKLSLNKITDFPEGMAQLTKNGIRQLHTLGQIFQAKYVTDLKFISQKYVNTEVYARSTNVDRALVSAMAFYSGFYESNNSTDRLFLAPVPVHSITKTEDFLDILGIDCPRKNDLWKIVDESDEIQALLNQSYAILADVSNQTGIPFNFYAMTHIFDAAILETLFEMPVPNWVKNAMNEFEGLFVNYTLTLYGFIPFKPRYNYNLQQELTKVASGALITEIYNRMALKIKCQNITAEKESKQCAEISPQKFYTYSTHDLTVVSLFAGLGFKTFLFEKYSMPAFGSTVVLELWKRIDKTNEKKSFDSDEKYYYIKIFYYKNFNVTDPLNLGGLLKPDCSEENGCPLLYLKKRAELLRPKPNWNGMCSERMSTKVTTLKGKRIASKFLF